MCCRLCCYLWVCPLTPHAVLTFCAMLRAAMTDSCCPMMTCAKAWKAESVAVGSSLSGTACSCMSGASTAMHSQPSR